MAVSLVSTGVQFPDSTIQTTAASAGGVTSVGSIVRKSGNQLYLATPTNTLLDAGYVPASGLEMSGTGIVALGYPVYSTFYGAWITYDTSTYVCYISKNGIDWTPSTTKPSDYNGSPPNDNGSIYVIDDSNGRIFCFGADTSNSFLGYWYKSTFDAAWSAFNSYLGASTNRNSFSAQFVWFGSAATSGIALAFSDSSTSYVAVIPAGTTSSVGKINTSNNNGQSMSMDWNQTGGTVVVMNRSAGSTSQYSVMYISGSNVNGTWVGVTRASCGFDPGTQTLYFKPVVGPSGAVMWSNMSSTSYYTAAAGSLGSTWTNVNFGSTNIIYYGHNGTSWYLAQGNIGTLSPYQGYFYRFYTTSSATPTSMSTTTVLPLLPLETGSVYKNGVWTQRKY